MKLERLSTYVDGDENSDKADSLIAVCFCEIIELGKVVFVCMYFQAFSEK